MHNVSNMNEPPVLVPGERHLGEVLDALRARAWLILTLAAAAAVLAAGLSSLLPRQYRASALVMVSSSKIPTSGDTTPASADRFAQTIATLLRSQRVADGVVRDQKVSDMTAQQLATAIQVQPVAGTMLLRVSLDHRDAGTAVRLLDSQTARVVALNRAIGVADLSDTREYLRTQVSDATTTLAAQERRLTEARATLQVESLRKRLDGSLLQRTALEAERDKFARQAAESGAQAQAYRDALTGQSKTVSLNRSLAEDASALPDAAAARGITRDQLLGLQLRSEVINPLFEEGEPALAEARAKEQGALAALESTKGQLAALDRELVQLQQQLAERTRAQAAAERDFELAKSTYEGFAKSYENARLSVAAQNAEVRIVEPATALPTPVSPRPLLNGVAAGLAVLLLGGFATLVHTYVREDRRPVAER
jgi:uncharacterized protein involved in exopolysaccharide biosynthesis